MIPAASRTWPSPWPAICFCAALLLGWVGVPAGLGAAERPPTVTAASILGGQTSGPGFAVDPQVVSDGFVNSFTLRMGSGTFDVVGNRLMQIRLNELAALRRLQAMSQSDAFRRSLGETAAAPLRFGQNLLTDPEGTLRGSVSGVANMFDRVGSAVSNIGNSRGNVANAVLGVDSARRELAFELGVDPNTDFPPLAAALADMARATAGGSLTVRALTLAVPGAAGLAIGTTATMQSVRELLRDRTSSQILDHVRQVLRGLGVPSGVAGRLIANRAYSATDLLVIATALNTLRAQETAIFVERAAEAVDRDEAFFQRGRAEMLAAQGVRLRLTEFVAIGGFPLNRARDGRVVAVFPFDALAWTDRAERAFTAATTALRRTGGTPGTLVMSGTITPMAQSEVTRLGWTVARVP